MDVTNKQLHLLLGFGAEYRRAINDNRVDSFLEHVYKLWFSLYPEPLVGVEEDEIQWRIERRKRVRACF